jgi:hypothetical protein
MKTFMLVVCTLIVPAQTLGQTGQAATGGAVTWAELDGAVIEAEMVFNRILEQNGHQFAQQAHPSWKIVISGDWMRTTWSATFRGPHTEQKAGPITGAAILNQPQKQTVGGPGQGVWHFEEETLTFTRTFKAGASRLKFVFSREGEALSCQASQSYAREHGSGPLNMDSATDRSALTMVSDQQQSQKCRVSKGTARVN